MIRARTLMTAPALILDITATCQDAALLMKKHDMGSVLISKNNYPIGIITERDLAKKVVALQKPASTPVEQVMSSPLFFSSPDADILEVAAAMNINNIKKVPVIENHVVLGMITQTDFLQHLFSLFKQMHEAYAQGRISSEEFVDKSAEIVKHLEQASLQDGRKNWHMTCADCGYVFLNPEVDGELRYDMCPSCRSKKISYQDA